MTASASDTPAVTSVGSLVPIRLPRRLAVPCGHLPPTETPDLKPAGTRVRRGDPLTLSVHQTAPATLAPADGRIVGPSPAPVALVGGQLVPGIELETDPQPEPGVAFAGPRLVQEAESVSDALHHVHPEDLGAWIDRLRTAGVWADRWASPDLLGQLNQCLRRPVDTVLCNALDSDAALPLQHLLADQFPQELVAGTALLSKLTGAHNAWVVLDEDDAPSLDASLAGQAELVGVRLVFVRNDYPQPNPTLLLHTLTRRRLPPDQVPPTHGVLLLDAAAAVAIGACVLRAEPLLRTPLAVHDGPGGRSHFLSTAVGTPLREVLAQLGIRTSGGRAYLRGGAPLRDVRITDECVVAGGGELTVYVTPEDTDPSPETCIRSGWCVESCPVRIQPAGLLEAAQRSNLALARRYGLDACIDCGICTFVCPSNLPLLHGIRVLRLKAEGEE